MIRGFPQCIGLEFQGFDRAFREFRSKLRDGIVVSVLSLLCVVERRYPPKKAGPHSSTLLVNLFNHHSMDSILYVWSSLINYFVHVCSRDKLWNWPPMK